MILSGIRQTDRGSFAGDVINIPANVKHRHCAAVFLTCPSRRQSAVNTVKRLRRLFFAGTYREALS